MNFNLKKKLSLLCLGVICISSASTIMAQSSQQEVRKKDIITINGSSDNALEQVEEIITNTTDRAVILIKDSGVFKSMNEDFFNEYKIPYIERENNDEKYNVSEATVLVVDNGTISTGEISDTIISVEPTAEVREAMDYEAMEVFTLEETLMDRSIDIANSLLDKLDEPQLRSNTVSGYLEDDDIVYIENYDQILGNQTLKLFEHESSYSLYATETVNSDYDYIVGVDAVSRVSVLDTMKLRTKELKTNVGIESILHDASPDIESGLRLDEKDRITVSAGYSPFSGPSATIGTSFSWGGRSGTKMDVDWSKYRDLEIIYTNKGGIAEGEFENNFAYVMPHNSTSMRSKITYDIGYGSNDGKAPEDWESTSNTIKWYY